MPDHQTMKIMYVEDNQANISLLQRIARMGGHQVINYTNGENALSNFEKDHPDLVLMDLQLEGRVSGLDVVKQLRARGFTTPIVAVTAYAMVGDRERCIEAGCNSYLSKPLPVAELVELVQTYEKMNQSKPEPTPVLAVNVAANDIKETAVLAKVELPQIEAPISAVPANEIKETTDLPKADLPEVEEPAQKLSEKPAEAAALNPTEEPTEPSKDPKLDLTAASHSNNHVQA